MRPEADSKVQVPKMLSIKLNAIVEREIYLARLAAV
jgi:hypothetical protein